MGAAKTASESEKIDFLNELVDKIPPPPCLNIIFIIIVIIIISIIIIHIIHIIITIPVSIVMPWLIQK